MNFTGSRARVERATLPKVKKTSLQFRRILGKFPTPSKQIQVPKCNDMCAGLVSPKKEPMCHHPCIIVWNGISARFGHGSNATSTSTVSN